ncbi:hypothetical protein E9232_001121 [Inquilinus ginsengisoli]|uniref:Uncharacterized protein n=1 Tax=Inquilinus ginsengisoli TaxID=363840 RepID=A0ABU1JKR1_9PROT|nr:hypothetical protein [Inquilinus ginsengisoli]MDR6288614.1 hypothetical protein [Inquilinus ginsengisoli]
MTTFANIGEAVFAYANAVAILQQHVATADLCATGRRVAAEGLRLAEKRLAHARLRREDGARRLRIEDEPRRRAA